MKRPKLAPDRAALAAEIGDLSKASITNLRERWKNLYGKPPLGALGRSFLIRAIAYRLQEKACGGLKPSTRRLLARVAEEAAAGSSPKRPPARMAEMGTILVREWQGNAHRVTVLGDGVSFNGKRYRSLSEVAREITGSRWSGPRFFGLRTSADGEQPWSALRLRSAVARSTRANLPKKAWSKTSTRCTHSARRAKRSSRVRPVRAGAW